MSALWMGVTWADVIGWLPDLLAGFVTSLQVTAASLLVGLPLGLLCALGVQSRILPLRMLCLLFVEIGRGAPALVLVQFVYFGLPSAGISLTSFMAAVTALAWSTGAYTSEIIRAGMDAVPAGHREAISALNLSDLDGLRFIILPQGLRVAMPALLGFAILVFQATSLCFTIALPELISHAYEIGTMTFFFFPVLATAGLFYVAVCLPGSFLVSYVERLIGRSFASLKNQPKGVESMTFYRNILAAAAIMAGAPAMADTCTPKHSFKTVEQGVITDAANIYSPYSMIDDAGNLTGIDGDILAAIAKMECLKVKPVPADGSAALQYVLSKKADTTSGDWYRTVERARVVHLSAPLYVDQMAVYSYTGLDSIDALLDNKAVGSTQGNLWNTDMKRVFGDKLKLYPNPVAMHQDLMAHRIEVGVDGASIGVVAQQQGDLKGIQIKVIKPDTRVAASQEAGQGAFPMTKDNDDLAKAFDDDIQALHEDGTIGKLLAKYGLSPTAADTGAPRLIK